MPASWSWLAPARSFSLARAQVGDAAAGDYALLDGRARGVQRILDPGLAFLHLDFGCRAHLDQRHAAGQLGQALLQLLLVVVAGHLLDLQADLLDPRLDRLLVARAVDEGRIFLGALGLLDAAEVLEGRFLELQPQLLGDHRAAGEHRDVLQHRLAPVAEAGRLDRKGLQDAADVVHHQRRERLALDLLGNDQQRLACLRHLLEQRQQLADRADFLVVQQDIGVFEQRALLLGVVDEVGREIPSVELHALD